MNAVDERCETPVAEAHPRGRARSQPAPPPALKTSITGAPEARRRAKLPRLHHMLKQIKPWGILFAVLAMFLSLASFWSDYSDRVEERTVHARRLVAIQAPGNNGKGAALEYLNSEDGLLCIELLRGHMGWLYDDNRISCLISFKAPMPLSGIDLSPPDPEDNGTPDNPSDDPIGTYLWGANLSDAVLDDANLSSAYLVLANLSGAYLSGADLKNANLSDADLSKANLSGADLSNADLPGAFLDDANLRGAGLGSANLNGAILSGADLSDTNLRGADLCGAFLYRANLSDVNLNGAVLSGAEMIDADLSSAHLSGADLSFANLEGANLWSANLSGADLRGTIALQQEQLDHACGDENTKLPEGLTIKPCAQEPAS